MPSCEVQAQIRVLTKAMNLAWEQEAAASRGLNEARALAGTLVMDQAEPQIVERAAERVRVLFKALNGARIHGWHQEQELVQFEEQVQAAVRVAALNSGSS